MIEAPQAGEPIAIRLMLLSKQDLEAAFEAKYVTHAGRHYADAIEKAMRAIIQPGTKRMPSGHNLVLLAKKLPDDFGVHLEDGLLSSGIPSFLTESI